MPTIWTMGEILVEIMRPRPDIQLWEEGEFLGPFPSGAPAIFIDTVARLGLDAGIIGGVGVDDFGRCVLERLQADGVDCSHVVKIRDRATAVAFVTYFHDGSRRFIYHIDGTPAVEGKLDHTDELPRVDCFHIMGCSLMVNETFRKRILDVMEFCHRQGAMICFDPNIRPELLGDRSLDDVVGDVMRACNILLPGTAELSMLGGSADVQENVAQVFASYPVELIVLKRGSQGSTVYTPGESFDVPAYTVKEVDPTGAGDCFDAGFLCGLLEQRPLDECARMAAAAGALNAAAFGPMEGNISNQTVAALIATGA